MGEKLCYEGILEIVFSFLIWIHLCFILESLHAKLNSHYETWSYKEKKNKKIKTYKKWF